MARRLKLTKFKDVPLQDPFFDSLKAGYPADFEKWFDSKKDEDVYIVVDDAEELSGMLYLKKEIGEVVDVVPTLPAKNWLKVGTLKIDGRGTRLGERVVKKIFDTAINEGSDGVYVTVFKVHTHLIRMLKRYGFTEWGTKTTKNGTEQVYRRDLDTFANDMIKDYPFISTRGKNHWLLAIKPKWHTQLLPDSILRNEPIEIVQDVSHTNTIHKVYISGVSFDGIQRGDTITFYRTADRYPAHHRSVVTSVCVVEEVRKRSDFFDEEAFVRYCKPRSVYTEDELREQWRGRGILSVAKMTYNVAFNKRLTRGLLIDEIAMRASYWVLLKIDKDQFNRIVELGKVNARLIVD
ncbi:L-amino acid N-acyltransferase YncA [Methylobacterium sp. RAS18]|nr:L-amino acid N-acyltransferase YncA [Methylobacterium sp. RAS18]